MLCDKTSFSVGKNCTQHEHHMVQLIVPCKNCNRAFSFNCFLDLLRFVYFIRYPYLIYMVVCPLAEDLSRSSKFAHVINSNLNLSGLTVREVTWYQFTFLIFLSVTFWMYALFLCLAEVTRTNGYMHNKLKINYCPKYTVSFVSATVYPST